MRRLRGPSSIHPTPPPTGAADVPVDSNPDSRKRQDESKRDRLTQGSWQDSPMGWQSSSQNSWNTGWKSHWQEGGWQAEEVQSVPAATSMPPPPALPPPPPLDLPPPPTGPPPLP